MKKTITVILSVIVASIFTWVICGYYLGELLHVVIPNMTHEQYTSYWFYAFISVEIIVLFFVSFSIIKWKK